MRKRVFFWTGLAISLASLAFVFYNSTVTGNAILSGFSSRTFSFIGLFAFVAGVLISMSGDSLQAYLAKKEQESPSPSLKDKISTRKEQKEFSRRYSGNLPWHKKLFKREVTQIQQDEKKYIAKRDYNVPEDGFHSLPLYQLEAQRAIHDKDKARAEEQYSELRKVTVSAWRGLKNKEIVAEGNNFPSEDNIKNFLNQVKSAADKVNLPFNAERWYESMKNKLPEFYSANLESAKKDLLGYLEDNRERVNRSELNYKISRMNELLGLSKLDRTKLGEVPLTEEEAYRHYRDKARTVKVSEFERKYGKTLVHAVPYKTTRKFTNNEDGSTIQGKDYLQILKFDLDNRDRVMISTSAVDKTSKTDAIFSPIGLVLEEGRIYDASREDIVSHAKENSRVAGQNVGYRRDEPLEARIEETVNHKPGSLLSWNEFIVGKYSPKGVYFIREGINKSKDRKSYLESENITPEETIRNLARFSLDNNLRFYEFVPGQGFVELNPRDYLTEKTKQQRTGPVKRSRKSVGA